MPFGPARTLIEFSLSGALLIDTLGKQLAGPLYTVLPLVMAAPGSPRPQPCV